jgi:hypothetical protein
VQKGLDDDTVSLIKKYHKVEIDLDNELSKETDSNEIKLLIFQWHVIQLKLQELWGFEMDKNYHKFWNLTACTCPKIDNEDRHPSGYYVYSGDCSLHGDFVK